MLDLLNWCFNVLIFSLVICLSLSLILSLSVSLLGKFPLLYLSKLLLNFEFWQSFLIAKSSFLCFDFICGSINLFLSIYHLSVCLFSFSCSSGEISTFIFLKVFMIYVFEVFFYFWPCFCFFRVPFLPLLVCMVLLAETFWKCLVILSCPYFRVWAIKKKKPDWQLYGHECIPWLMSYIVG